MIFMDCHNIEVLQNWIWTFWKNFSGHYKEVSLKPKVILLVDLAIIQEVEKSPIVEDGESVEKFPALEAISIQLHKSWLWIKSYFSSNKTQESE